MENTMGERIRSIRAAHNLTQQEFAEKIGCARSTVTNYELDQKIPLNPVIATICREFDVDEHWLRTGEGDMCIPMTREEEIASLVAKTISGSNEFKKAVVRTICSRTDAELAVLEAMLTQLLSEFEKNKDQA